jgi:hypothetical protein
VLDETCEAAAGASGDRALALAEHGALLIAAAFWILIVTPSSGGFHDVRTAWLLLLMAPGLLLARPWRNAPTAALVIVPLMALGAGIVLLVTPTGWAQADSVADQLAGGLALILVISYARNEQRRAAVAAALAVALLVECYQAWFAWWGSGNPNTLVRATFYWHNQTGAYVGALACLLVGVGLVARRGIAWAAIVLAGMGIGIVVLTTSRAALGLLVLGLLALLVVGVRAARWLGVARWGLVLAVAAGLLLLFTSRPFFPHHAWAGPPLLASGSGAPDSSPSSAAPGGRGIDTLGGNGSARAVFTEAAVRSWLNSPVEGSGFGSFLITSPPLIHGRTGLSTFAHDGFAESLQSGGLLFGGPLLTGAGLLTVAALRALVRRENRPPLGRGITIGATTGALLLLAHSAVDFDWHYSSLAVALAVLGGLAVAAHPPRASRSGIAPLVAIILLLTVALGATGSLVEHHGREAVQTADVSPAQLLDAQLPIAYDSRLAVLALVKSLSNACQLTVSPGTARRVYEATQRIGRLDPTVRRLREQLQRLQQGDRLTAADCT